MKHLRYIAILGLLFVWPVAADEVRQCSVAVTTGGAATTASPTSGTCSWERGATIVMQCDVAVYWNATKSATTGNATTATSSDLSVDFTTNSDPYKIDLAGNAKHVSVLSVTSSGTCKFGPRIAKKL